MGEYTNCRQISPNEREVGFQRTSNDGTVPHFAVYDGRFRNILGSAPNLKLALKADYPFAHEAGVYIPIEDKVFVTSNQLQANENAAVRIEISELSRKPDGSWTRTKIDPGIVLANGGVNYGSDVLFCAQGDKHDRGGLVLMQTTPPYSTTTLLDSYHGRCFNSLNDVIIKSDGSIWFTDPVYGFEQGIRLQPQLPSQVYRFDPQNADVRVVADGFGRPNGLCFSPDERTLYVTDTDWIHGDGTTDDTRSSTIYAFDVIRRSESDFLANRRVFAMADTGIPDGIKCDTLGNVYSGCGDGLNVWAAGGSLLGKIVIPGGVANFCFARKGELLLLNEDRFWVATIDDSIEGALLARRK